tara:strand:+ start:1408 stop:2637 length:1230 start_codon:yes stop_codon:yes gene_type:complete
MSLNLTNSGNTAPTRSMMDSALGSPTDRDLALKVFSGAVLDAFRQRTVFFDRKNEFMAMKQLDGGHMAQWPILGEDIEVYDIGDWDVSGNGTEFENAADIAAEGGLLAGYHSPGDFIEGRKIKMSEATVRVDDMLVAAIDVPFIDLDLSHFDVLSPFATKIGRSLAIDNDRKIATIARKAALDGGETGIYPGGSVVYRTGAATVANVYQDNQTGSGQFRDDVAELAEKLDDNFVPEENRVLFITPYIRRILRHEATLFGFATDHAGSESSSVYGPAGNPYSKDTSADPWDLNKRTVGMLEGFKLVVTNSLPGDWTTTTNGRYNLIDSNLDKYDFDCTGATTSVACPAAIALCGASEGNAAMGMVQAGGLSTVVEDDHRRNVKFLKSQMLVGYDILSPWCAGMIGVATSA